MSSAQQDNILHAVEIVFVLIPIFYEIFFKKGKRRISYLIILVILAALLFFMEKCKISRDNKEKDQSEAKIDSISTDLKIVIENCKADSLENLKKDERQKVFENKLDSMYGILRDSITNEPYKVKYNTKIDKARDVYIGDRK